MPFVPNEPRRIAGSREFDFCLSVTDHMNMRRFVIVRVDNDAHSKSAVNGDHR